MAKQTIFTGTVGNDRTGDKLRIAFTKANENFTELYDRDVVISNVANAAFNVANAAGGLDVSSAYNTANQAYDTANAAFNAANTGGGGNFNNSAAFIVLTDTPFASDFGEEIYFQRPNYSDDTIVDVIDTGLSIARANTQGLYNPLEEVEYNGNGPTGTEWSNEGWTDLTNVKRRTYTSWVDAINGWPTSFLDKEMVMHDTINDKYYAIKFLTWQFGANNGGAGGGGFSYIRKLINVENFFKKLGTDANTYYDTIDTGVALARGSTGGALYNPLGGQNHYDRNNDDLYPSHTRWNADGWDNLTNLTSRQWLSFVAASGKYAFEFIYNKEFVMHDTLNDKYYAIKFTDWGQNNGGSFSYHRQLIDTDKLNYGVRFPDGSLQTTADLNKTGLFKFFEETVTVPSKTMFIYDDKQNGITTISNSYINIVWSENIDVPNRDWNNQTSVFSVDWGGTHINILSFDGTNYNGYQWNFDRNGNFELPYYYPHIYSGSGVYLKNGLDHTWHFNNDDQIVFPDSTIQSTAFTGGIFDTINAAFTTANTASDNLSNYVLTSDLSNTLGEYSTTAIVNAAFDTANAAFNTANNINVANIYIDNLVDVNIDYETISAGYVLKWNGNHWEAGVDATTGGAGTDADTLEGQHGSYYLEYSNFANTPNLSIYETTTNVANSLISANNYAGYMANAANAYASSLSPDVTAANNFAGFMANSVNAYTSATYATLSSLTGYATTTNAEAAFDTANSGYTTANGGFTVANAAYDKANSANVLAYNTGIGANAYSSSVGTNANTYANDTFLKLTATEQTITGNLSITGNLTLLGGSTTISSNNLIVGDSLIYLAANNYSGTDILDIGFIANYGNTTAANVHTGLLRDATTKQYYLFQEYGAEPANNTFVPGSNNMTNAVLNADLITSNLTLGGANTISWITSAYNTANAANGYTNTSVAAANAWANSVSVTDRNYTNTSVAAANAWANTILTNGTSNVTFNNVTATNITTSKLTKLGGTEESFGTYSSVTGVTAFDCTNSYIFYVTPTGNFTANLTNFTCDTNNVTSVTLILNQGVTPYMSINNLLIGSANLTINWQGGTAPTGTASKKDVLTFSILNVNGSNTVLGQLVSFG